MRTTLTLDEDLAVRLKDLSRQRGVPFKQIVNETLRCGLEIRRAKGAGRFRVATRDLGLRPGISLDNIAELVEQVDGAEYR